MAITLSLNHPNDWLQRSSPDEVNLRHFDDTDIIQKCPKYLGKGYMQDILLWDGLTLTILDLEFKDDFVREITTFVSSSTAELEFVLNGSHPGQSLLILRSNHQIEPIVSRYRGNQRFFKVELHLQLPILKVFLDGLLEQLPATLQDAVTVYFEQLDPCQIPSPGIFPEPANALIVEGVITPQMHHLLQQILHCPYRGLNRRLYLQGKALELMTLRSQQIIEQSQYVENQLTGQICLQSDELRRICWAKEILLRDLQHPPSIPELAQQVSLNRRKLSEGFQQVFHMTPFGYLQDYRLRQARNMLSYPDIKVEDVIQSVGYKSRSSFAVAFRKKFGLNPKLYQQQLAV